MVFKDVEPCSKWFPTYDFHEHGKRQYKILLAVVKPESLNSEVQIMENPHFIKQDLVEVVLESIGGYKLTPLLLEMIRFLLKGIYEGLILFDKEGNIEFMDKCTEKFFGLKPGEAKGLHITQLVPNTKLSAKFGVPCIGKIQEVKGQKKIVSELPIKKGGEVVGVLGKVIVHELEEIENLNKEIQNLKVKIDYYKEGAKLINSSHYNFENLLGISPKFVKVKQLALKIAPMEANVLLEGESGTGKELFAHSIHNLSRRRNRPFIRVNCPSIPFELAESELFGYEKGAFSGARNEGKPGKFELSEGGTIFLDEIGSLPLSIQGKLLRVLQEKEIERLGGRNTIKVNFRLIAATNVSLSELVARERFRADLFYRLNTVPIKIPPLRERNEDIPLFVDYFLKEINKSVTTNVSDISDEALQVMMSYGWPGNVRELANVLEQSVLSVAQGHIIKAENLPSFIFEKDDYNNEDGFGLRSILRETERQTIEKVLSLTGGNKRRAAKLLGIQRCVLYQKMKKYRVESYPHPQLAKGHPINGEQAR